LAIGRDLGDDMIVGWSLHNLGHVAMQTGNLEEAYSLFRESLLVRMPLGPGVDVASGMCGIAGVRMREGDLRAALHAFGAAEKMLIATNFVLPPADEIVRRADVGTIRSQLDEDAFAAGLREGETLNFEELDALANPAAKERVAG
jgi:predicted hydrolase (HD superfamily)